MTVNKLISVIFTYPRYNPVKEVLPSAHSSQHTQSSIQWQENGFSWINGRSVKLPTYLYLGRRLNFQLYFCLDGAVFKQRNN